MRPTWPAIPKTRWTLFAALRRARCAVKLPEERWAKARSGGASAAAAMMLKAMETTTAAKATTAAAAALLLRSRRGPGSASPTATLGFVVSSAIRKERSAAREATGVLCSLLGVPEAEEEEEEEEEGEVEVEEGKGEEEKNKGDKANGDNDGDNDDEKKNRKKPSGPCLTPTLSPVREKR